MFISITRKLLFKHKASSKAYIEYLRNKGAQIGEDVTIYSPNQTYIDEQFPYMLKIGNHVNITLGVHILNHDYSWAVLKQCSGNVFGGVGYVNIGNNVFIGVNSVILMNTNIGSNVIIGAGSIVHGNVPNNCVVAGNPAKIICSIDEFMQKRRVKQYNEAAEMVRRYRSVFGKEPPKEKLPAYFFLFEPRKLPINSTFLSRMKLTGNYDQSLDVFFKSRPMFKDYEDFLNSVK